MKKQLIISCLLAACSICAFADETTVVVNGATLSYTADAGHNATITGATELPDDGILIIPDTFRVEGTKYTVIAIEEGAFNGESETAPDLKAVAIPTYVTNIGENAFHGCTNLEWVVVRNTDPKNNVSVGTSAFPNFTTGTAKLYVHDQFWGSVKVNTSGMVVNPPDFDKWKTYFAEENIYPYAAVNLDPKDKDAFYGTIYFGSYAFDVAWPEGVQAYTAATADGSSLNMNAIHRVGETLTIPADNGVVLRRPRVDEEDNISFILLTPTAKAESEYIVGNVFQGYENYGESVLGGAPSYVLYGDANHGVGFYQYGGATYQAFRAFYHPSSPSGAPARISLNFNHSEQTTGVNNVQSDNVQCTKEIRDGQLYLMYEGRMYDVQGQIVK